MDFWKRLNIFDKGLSPNLTQTGSAGSSPIVQPTPDDGPTRKPPVSSSVKSEDLRSGDLSVPLYSVKRSPQDTANGFWMGWDKKDHLFKWSIGSPFAQMDFNVTSPGVFYINLPRSGAGTNAIFINDGSNDNNAAIDVRRFNGTGEGIGINSSAGHGLGVRQHSDTPAIYAEGYNIQSYGGIANIYSKTFEGTSGAGYFADILGTGSGFRAQISSASGDFANPFVGLQNHAVSDAYAVDPNYYKQINMNGGGLIDVQIYVANNDDPNGDLTGEKGDFLISTNGKLYQSQGDGIGGLSGTVWNEISGNNTGDQNLFSQIDVAGEDSVIADSPTTTLTLVAGTDIGITTDNTTKEITISNTATPFVPTSKFTFCTDFAASTRYTFESSNASATFNELGVVLENSSGGGREVVEINCGGGPIYFNDPTISFSLTNPTCVGGTDKSIFAGIGDVSDGTNVADYTNRHVGVKLIPTADDTFSLYATQGDGSTENDSSAICTVTETDFVEVVIDTVSDTSATYYVSLSGVPQTPVTLTGDMPDSTTFVPVYEYMTVGIFNNS